MSSSSVLRAWWTSQSMTGPEYMRSSLGCGGWRGGCPPPRRGYDLRQRFDLIGADLVGDGVMQDLDRLVDGCIRIRRDLAGRLSDALDVGGIALLLGRHGLGVRQRVAERLVERRREVEEAVRLRDLLARRDEARAVGDERLVVIAFDDLQQAP